MFGVITEKLLGFIVYNRGIEAETMKVKAILEMPLPSTLQKLRRLQEKLQSIRRFITQLVDKCQPFQHFLKKSVTFKWTNQCQEEFQALKDYLLSAPGKPLLLYILATNSSLYNSWHNMMTKGKKEPSITSEKNSWGINQLYSHRGRMFGSDLCISKY